MESEHKRTYQE